jgi:hypothetical protein
MKFLINPKMAILKYFDVDNTMSIKIKNSFYN